MVQGDVRLCHGLPTHCQPVGKQQGSAREKFTAAEERRLNWALIGEGPKSLYGTPNYHVLNDIAARVATFALHPVLNRYLEDDEPGRTTNKNGGDKWSDHLYKSISTDPSSRQIKQSLKPSPSGTKAVNLPHVLDSSKTNANKLAAKVAKSASMDVRLQGVERAGGGCSGESGDHP